jgi:GT2 family glycosyltransferase
MPHFKSAFNPELLRSNNYICHLLTIKKDLLEQVGGFCSEFDGSQDHDLILRVSEKAKTIIHIADVLYHWRSHRESVAQNMDAKTYALAAGRKAVEEHLQRLHRSGKVEVDEKYPGTYKVQYDLISHPFVSIIIPNMDHVEDLRRCLESIDHSTYDNYEVIIVENNSVKPETFAYYDTIRSDRVHILSFAGPFNFSKINNEAVKQAIGEHVVLLNNDTKCLTPDWIEQLLQYSQYDDIGAVGAKLLYPDNTVQHAGVIIGLGGIAGHAHLNRKKDDPGYMFRAVVPQAIGAVTGACLMIRKDKYLGVGGLNDDFAVAFNDIDLCLRLMKAGYRNIFTPYVQMVHYESKSRGNDMDPDKIDRFSSEVDLFEQLWDMCRFSDQFYNPNFSLRNPSIGGFSVIGERLKNKQIRTNNSDISKN